MIGNLAVSFCDRGAGANGVCLDLWSYPDGTYNLVIENFAGDADKELVFPCVLHQLAGPLDQKSFVSENEEGKLEISRCEELVCAEFVPFDGREGFRHCIPQEEYQLAIAALEANTSGYLA